MHFCADELQAILFVINGGMEHAFRYAKASCLYVCHCARCLARKVVG